MISQDPQFKTANVNVYIDQTLNMINYQLNSNQRLEEQGIYYIYLATCDYYNDIIKTQRKTVSMLFAYKFNYSLWQGICQVVFYQQKPLGHKLLIRQSSNIRNKIFIYKWLKFNLDGMLQIYNELIEVDLSQCAYVCYRIDHDDNALPPIIITVKKTVWDLDLRLNVIEQYSFDVGGKLYVYLQNTGSNIYSQEEQYENGWRLKFSVDTFCFEKYDTPQFGVDVYRRYNSEGIQSVCQVWNELFPPAANHSLITLAVAVSNFVYASRLLYHSLTIYYPAPPMVIVTSNIEQKKWQQNYKAEYYLTLKEQQMRIPFAYYQYFIDKNQNVTNESYFKMTGNNVVKVDLRSIDRGKQTGRFYFHVRSVNTKNIRSKQITTYAIYYNNPIDTPTILTINGFVVTGNQRPVVNYTKSIILYWTQIFDGIDIGDIITYELQISQSYLFETLDYQKNNILNTTYNIPPQSLSSGLYYCRVRAFDQNQYSSWSYIAIFYVNKAPYPPTELYVKTIL